MFRRFPSIYLIFCIFLLFSCEDLYNFEANKLNKKSELLIEESKKISDLEQKLKLLTNALEKNIKIQKKYPKTKIARALRKTKKVNLLNIQIEDLKKELSKEKIAKKKEDNLSKIKKSIDLAATEYIKKNFNQSSLSILNASLLTIDEISDTRSKSRLLNQISQIQISLNNQKDAFKNLERSKKNLDNMQVDIPKKIKNLLEIYKMLHYLNENERKNEIENEIYQIIETDILNNDNKALALMEIAQANFIIKDLDKVKNDTEQSFKIAEKSNTFLLIAKMYFNINDLDKCTTILNKAKNTAKSTNQEFWIVRELIKIAIFENSINFNELSNATLIDAKNYAYKNNDDRIITEVIGAFAKINNLSQAEEMLNLMAPSYEKGMAMTLIGRELANNRDFEKMEFFLNKALETVPDIIVGKYALGLPGFSIKARVYLEAAKSYALANNFPKANKLLSMIESDRFYKEGVIYVLYLEAKKNSAETKKLSIKLLNFGGKIIDNKFIGNIAHIQSLIGDIKNSFKNLKKMDLGVDLAQTLINIAKDISLQQEDPSI